MLCAELLRSVDQVYGQKTVEITGQEGVEYTYLKMDGYGLQLAIPPGALEVGVKYTIAFKVISISAYKLPYEAEIVSAFYWVFSSHKFRKPVDLQIQHCARLQQKGSTSRMSFIVAKCDQELLPYKFRKRDGVFELQSRQGLIPTKQFSFFAIIRDYVFPGLEPAASTQSDDTFYVFKVFGKKCGSRSLWHFDIFFLKDIDAYITVGQEYYMLGI